MPRKDRRFTGDDVKRFYCKNLTPYQRHIFDILDCDWSDYSRAEQTEKLFKALLDSDLLRDLVNYLPGGNYIQLALNVIQYIIEGGVPEQIELFPVFDLEDTLDKIRADREKREELEPVPRVNLEDLR